MEKNQQLKQIEKDGIVLNDLKNRWDNNKNYKRLIRFLRKTKPKPKTRTRSKKTTFIFPNGESFRVVRGSRHLEFLKKFKWMYSTSANLHGKRFNEKWAREAADVIVEDKRGFVEGKASNISLATTKA